MLVFVEDHDHLVRRMFERDGHMVTFNLMLNDEMPDLAVFTGGADINPELYGERCHPRTHFDEYRDDCCVQYFNLCKEYKIPMVGICRGAQFLNVMCGGKMFQHVDNHCTNHKIIDWATNDNISVTSTHHQMMIPGELATIVATADGVANKKEYMHNNAICVENRGVSDDTEVVYYKDDAKNIKALCFQPHPEYAANSCRDYFFELLNRYELLK